MKSIATLSVVAFFATVGTPCRPVPQPTPRPTIAPIATPAPNPTSPPVLTFQFTNGDAIIHFRNIDKLPLSKTSDNFALGVLTWETTGFDRTKPVIELSVRGTSQNICMARPCQDRAGLVFRYSANLAYDDTLDWSTSEAEHESQKVALGQGINYHRRLALGGPNVSVTIKLTPTTIEVLTPVDSSVFSLLEGQLSAPNSMGVGRFISGVPWSRKDGRSWLWNQFDGTKFGVDAEVLSWKASGEQSQLVFYP